MEVLNHTSRTVVPRYLSLEFVCHVLAGMSQMSAQLTSESKQYAQRAKDLHRQVGDL